MARTTGTHWRRALLCCGMSLAACGGSNDTANGGTTSQGAGAGASTAASTASATGSVGSGGGTAAGTGGGGGAMLVPPSVWLATTGDDATCARGDSSKPCATFDKAYHVAVSGDVIAVAAGKYPMTEPNAGATTIFPDGSKASAVTFSCQGDGDVTFDAPNFAFYPGTAWVVMTGDCFHFHVVNFGYGGYSDLTHDISLHGVHTASFECAGCSNVTIERSEIGPAVACYAPGTTGNGDDGFPIPQSAWCDPAQPDEAYWATLPKGSSGQQMEPYIHNGGAGIPKNIALVGNRIHGIQTKDSANAHTGGLLIWNVDGLTLRGNRWDHNAIYDIETNAGDVENNVTIENNFFGWPVDPIEPTQPNPGGETPKDWREVTAGYPGSAYSGWLIRFNSFAHGLLFEGGCTGCAVVGNILGNYSTCNDGASYDHNVGVADGTSCGGISVAAPPYVDYANVDFHLVAGSSAIDAVPDSEPAAELVTDIDGNPRPCGAAREAGADEVCP